MALSAKAFGPLLGLVCALLGIAIASAADVSLVSMQYSVAHPVPHIRYDGETLDGDLDRLKSIYDKFVHCRVECLRETGGSTAVLTLNGPGGHYLTGLLLAEFIRENNIATVVERGMECYSACAFAFLGGSGYSSDKSIRGYVDRVIEPGGVVGFHAPYANDDALRAALETHLPSDVLSFNRSNLALMVRQLVRWNVDPEIVFYMLDMGPDEFYYLSTPDDLYLTRTSLPPTSTSLWVSDVPAAVRNACVRLLAAYERIHPALIATPLSAEYTERIGHTQTGRSLSGYRISTDVLALGHCSVLDDSVDGLDLEVALYINTAGDGYSLPLMTMFNLQDWYSSAGIGGDAYKRIFQRGAMNHWFLPLGVALEEAVPAAGLAIPANRFFVLNPPALPPLRDGFVVDRETTTTRVSHSGGLWLFEEVGGANLFAAAMAFPQAGPGFTYSSANDNSFVRGGTHADGTPVTQFGYLVGENSLVVQTMVLPFADNPYDPDEIAGMTRIACDTQFEGMRLSC